MRKINIDKIFDDSKIKEMSGKTIQKNMISKIINNDSDVYYKGRLIARFRKNVLPRKNIELFYNNVISFAKNTNYNRGELMGVEKGKRGRFTNKTGAKTNIIGYMDGFSPSQKIIMKKLKIKSPMTIRKTRFVDKYPDKWNKTIPLIKNIDSLYKSLIPLKHKKQNNKARRMKFRIKNTSFTTVTTNVNVDTKIHKDKGDDEEGFGNLTVIEKGDYTGGETCLPQYGIGFNVRSGDILFMDVHEWHGNLPINLKTPDSIRLSIVCYLRTNIFKQEMKFNKTQKNKHNKFLEKLTKKNRLK